MGLSDEELLAKRDQLISRDIDQLAAIKESQATEIFYEAPHRLIETLEDVTEVLGALRKIVVAREVTKIYEEFIRGSAGEVLHRTPLQQLSRRPRAPGKRGAG